MDTREVRIHLTLTKTIESWLEDINQNNKEFYYKHFGSTDYFDHYELDYKKIVTDRDQEERTRKYEVVEDYNLVYIPNELKIICHIIKDAEGYLYLQYNFINLEGKEQLGRRHIIDTNDINYYFDILCNDDYLNRIIINLEQEKLKFQIDNF
jgi:hypothetical protein